MVAGRYLPTTRLTLAPFRSLLPAAGLCPTTLPRLRALECRLLIAPTRQWAFVIAALALASDLPTTFGTTQLGGVRGVFENVALTVWFAVIESTHAERPEQSPDQPTKRDRAPACCESETVVPFANV